MRRPPAITKYELSREVADILGLPRHKEWGTAYDVVTTIVKAMTTALKRGESIKIDGFGIFTLRTRKPTRSPVQYFYGNKGKTRAIINLPRKTYVVFKPSKPLMRMINHV